MEVRGAPVRLPGRIIIAPLLLALSVLALHVGVAWGAEENCSVAPNPVVCENALPGAPPSAWQVEEVGDPSIQGFATSMSVDVGQTERFKISTPSSAYHINIFRLGYYGGNGARLVASGIKPSVSLPQVQPECLKDSSTGLIDCGNWGESAQWTVPSSAVSGMYIALLVRDDTGGRSQIPFVVRNDSSHSEILLQTSDATWEAYNAYGGNSLYTCTVSCPPGSPELYKGAYAVSYNRPFDGALSTDGGASYLFYAEYQMMRWLEKNGYNVSYTSESQVDNNGALLKNHRVFVSSGHDEYWSAGQRASVEAAREAGVNLAFFSANEIYWKTRWGPSTEGSSTPYRTLTTYKETHFQGPTDPLDPSIWTGAWRDPRASPPADGGKPENSLSGQQFEVNSGTSEITVPAQYAKLRLWRNTEVANLKAGQTLTLAPETGTLGYEWDEDVDNGYRPAGEFDLSSTTVSGVQTFTDYGSNLNGNATATHHLTLYRAASGALVFGAGTVQWAWGLDNTNAWKDPNTDPGGHPPDPNMQQYTVNLLAEMGAQPGSLTPGLLTASKTTDTNPPTSTITSPTAESTIADGSAVTIKGTATDTGGGVIAGVEVSTDNGASWHPATLTTPTEATVNWSYSWDAHGNPTTTIKSRAVDDSANIETPSSGTPLKISCPCTIWGNAVTPPEPDSGDNNAVELGMKFTSDTFGTVTGIRFYKSAANTGTHTGSLWSTTGERLATATFTSETTSGWQEATFSKPVTILPNTTYIASYFDPNGHYADSEWYFYTPPPTAGNNLNSPPLHATPANTPPQNGLYTSNNGLFTYSTNSTFPTGSFHGSNYWVEPVLVPAAAPGQVTGVKAAAGAGSASVTWSAPASGGPVTKYTITPYIGSTAQTPTVVSGTPPETGATVTGLSNGTTYTFTVTAANPNGSGPASEPSNAVTPTSTTPPSAPTGVSAVAATGQAVVSWTAPSSNGGSPITKYTVTPYIGTEAQPATTVTGSPPATTATVKGLTNGATYTFKVTASNSAGESLPSSPSAPVTPQNMIFDLTTPAAVDSGDSSPVELGVKFSSEVAGSVTGVRFYKAAANTGTHVGSLWTSGGTLLASATFSGETASGWQQVSFSKPVAISAGTTYVAGYLAPLGHYSDNPAMFASKGVSNPPLSALANPISPDGVYAYSATSTFPTNSFNATNYWVDVTFEAAPATPPGQVTGVKATAGTGSATVTWNAPATGGAPTKYTVTPFIGSEAQTPTVVNAPETSTTISGLANGTSYTFTVTAANANGNGPASEPSNAVTPTAATAPAAPSGVTAAPAGNGSALVSWTAPNNGGSTITKYTITPYIGSEAQTASTINGSPPATSTTVTGLTNGTAYTFTVTATNSIGTGPPSEHSNTITPVAIQNIFGNSTPATVDSGDSSPVELGVKFSSEVAGSVTGVRFYKAAANTGTHVGSLWTSGGTLLASATFSGETASGWQQVSFSKPVAISAGTTYVAGYLAPLGHYSDNPAMFASKGVSNPPLSALANPISPDGVYAYSATSTFPTNSFNATNYWVDVTFEAAPATPPGQVTGVKATAGTGSATVTWNAPATGGAPTKYTVTPFIGSEAQTPTVVNAPETSTTISGLANGTSYTFTVTAANANGNGPASEPSNAVTPTAATAPAAPSGVTAAPAGNGSALVSWTAPNNGGSTITKYTITPYIGSEAQTASTINGSPPATSTTVTGLTNGTAYTFTVTATNSIGTGPPSEHSNTITPVAIQNIFGNSTPVATDSGDGNSVELGVKFSSEVAGSVTGVRFYKAAANTGTHVGSLWTSGGTLLASATFSGESSSGWQQVSFSKPVAISAGTTYVAGYLAPLGHYSDNPAMFASSGVSNPPLTALANPISSNGVYAYSKTSTFPTNSFNATNYWVDVTFEAGH